MLVGETTCCEGALVQQGSRVIGCLLLEEVRLALQGNHIHEVEWGGCGRNGTGGMGVCQGGASSAWCTCSCDGWMGDCGQASEYAYACGHSGLRACACSHTRATGDAKQHHVGKGA